MRRFVDVGGRFFLKRTIGGFTRRAAMTVEWVVPLFVDKGDSEIRSRCERAGSSSRDDLRW